MYESALADTPRPVLTRRFSVAPMMDRIAFLESPDF
jgi:hypothetical protein